MLSRDYFRLLVLIACLCLLVLAVTALRYQLAIGLSSRPPDAFVLMRLQTPEWEKIPVALTPESYERLEGVLESTDTLVWTSQAANTDRYSPGAALARLETEGLIVLCKQSTRAWQCSGAEIPMLIEIAEGPHRGKRGFVSLDMIAQEPLPVP